ncbi:MAG: redoxin domain-containing protein [Deltaproteobacteria bacterium]|nr:MAG: redoxin domain-containing protein [Deltaproteobacteria bacterium]
MRAAALLGALALLLGACGAMGGAGRLTADDGALLTPAGEPVALADTWRAHDATVLVFWGSTCPCVKRYEGRVAALRERYHDGRVAFRYVASNADDDLAALTAARAAGREVLPLVKDPAGVLARTLGVISTPTAVLVDRAGAVRFRGWIDNERVPGDPDREPWLEEAVDTLLAGGSPRAATPVWGCTITRSLTEARRCTMPEPEPEPVPTCH